MRGGGIEFMSCKLGGFIYEGQWIKGRCITYVSMMTSILGEGCWRGSLVPFGMTHYEILKVKWNMNVGLWIQLT